MSYHFMIMNQIHHLNKLVLLQENVSVKYIWKHCTVFQSICEGRA